MAIHRFYNYRITIMRIKDVGGASFHARPVTSSTIDAHIQRVGDSNDPLAMGVGATHKAWCDISHEIQDGDVIKTTDEREREVLYQVLAITNEGRDTAINEHKELMLKIYDDERPLP